MTTELPARLLLATGLSLTLAATSCAQQANDTLVFTIEQALTTARTADFATIVPGDWDRVCIFRPGSTYETVDSVIGVHSDAARDSRIEERTDATLILFVRDSTEIEHVLYPIRKGDFGTPGPEQWYCRPRTGAVFEMRQPIDGSIPWIGPAAGR